MLPWSWVTSLAYQPCTSGLYMGEQPAGAEDSVLSQVPPGRVQGTQCDLQEFPFTVIRLCRKWTKVCSVLSGSNGWNQKQVREVLQRDPVQQGFPFEDRKPEWGGHSQKHSQWEWRKSHLKKIIAFVWLSLRECHSPVWVPYMHYLIKSSQQEAAWDFKAWCCSWWYLQWGWNLGLENFLTLWAVNPIATRELFKVEEPRGPSSLHSSVWSIVIHHEDIVMRTLRPPLPCIISMFQQAEVLRIIHWKL